MYKLVASDMDETFLAHDHTIPAANLEAVRRLADLGVEFVPASGRGFDSVMMTLEGLTSAGLAPSHVISYNGGCITEAGTGRVLTSATMPFDLLEEAFELSRRLDLCFHAYVLNGPVWCSRMNASERDFLAGRMLVEDFPEDDVDFLANEPIAKCLIQSDDFGFLHEVGRDPARYGAEHLVESTTVVYSSNRYIEFCPKGVDKGSGLAHLAGLLGIGLDECIGCGDSVNDLAMIRAAGLGVGAANVTPDVAPSCDYVCSATCDEGVIAEVVDHFVAPQHTPVQDRDI
ncbi:MAG: HAD-IIB family hydrolase [Atopobiaceae bacterium]|jgi:Cof subfamily protein (haloacid dehalogenase superfamily)|nr:HAD-IIB family hydrolase [Atopobiaceae bacterium]MCH4180101.1 HAD-IIB family hydrolase [Atopobiaceae bacterium]MCH4213847.1 HAD-IIB family hydrolase [Atopobiaceae bacterium]MCH4229949.1 HAD-IIB family hydrolase [Atopobiaceae bacterium]MCH4275690.1 HAD-IIB family hydrolase [Atopobiaceae bacterium]